MSNIDERMGKMMQSFIDGIPLDLASELMRGHGGGLSAQAHIHMHAKSIAKHNDDGKKGNVKRAVMKKNALVAFCESLRKDTSKLSSSELSSEWGDYYSNTNYTAIASDSKGAIVGNLLREINPLKSVWDLGANDGRYTRIAMGLGANTVAFDIDANAVRQNWKK